MSCIVCHFIVSYSMTLSFLSCRMGVIRALFSFPKSLAAHRDKQYLAYVNHREQADTGGLWYHHIPLGVFSFWLGHKLFMDRGCLSRPPHCFLTWANAQQRLLGRPAGQKYRRHWTPAREARPGQWAGDRLEPVASPDFSSPKFWLLHSAGRKR